MKFVRCQECGTELEIKRIALPKHGQIIDVIPQHVCPPNPIEFNPNPNPIPVSNGKFVSKLNDLAKPTFPPTHNIVDTNLKDLRSDVGKSTAPQSIFDQIESMKKHGSGIEPEHKE
jgi:hypothetical protein